MRENGFVVFSGSIIFAACRKKIGTPAGSILLFITNYIFKEMKKKRLHLFKN